jgi:hypothetical protein
MNTNLPQSVAAYMQSASVRDTEALLTTFVADAIVTDEGHEYHGIDEIRRWRNESSSKYQYTVDVTDVAEIDKQTVLTTQLTGNFPGSPVQLHFYFVLEGAKIAALSIRP